MSLRSRLSVLVGLAVLPPLVLSAYNTYTLSKALEKQAAEEALASARLIAAELEQLIDGTRYLMITLVKHASVPDNEDECSAYFKSVLADIPIYREAALIDRAGKFHCSTIAIPPNLNVSDRFYFNEPLRTGSLTIGSLTTGRVTGQESIHISLPYRSPDGRFDGVVVFVLNPERMGQALAERRWQTQHRVIVADREGSVVISVPLSDLPRAQIIAKKAFDVARTSTDMTFVAKSSQGYGEIIGLVPVQGEQEGLLVAVGIDRDTVLAQVWVTIFRSIGVGLATILLASGLVWLAAYAVISRPIKKLVEAARRRQSGDMTVQFPKLRSSTELGQLSTALRDMSEKNTELLNQKQLLLRELQHRVMNSLQILASLLGLQGRQLSDPEAAEQLNRARDRVLSMGSVYRFLYQAERFDKIDLGEFVKVICKEAQQAYSATEHSITVTETIPITVDGEQAASLAVLLHELITNALKHAYVGDDTGSIEVKLIKSNQQIELRVIDHGRGMPPGTDIESPASLGLKVILTTARQLGGAVTFRRLDPGSEFIVRFGANFAVSEAA